MSPNLAQRASEPSARFRRLRGTIELTSRYGRRGLTPAILAWAVAPVGACATLAAVVPPSSILWNGTDSEPVGLYVRTTSPPAIGRIIAFRAPAGAFPYADERMGYLHRVPILKAIGAGEGDAVCTQAGVLTINGRRRAAVFDHDPRGRALPQWRGCRTLQKGEFFVFSDRVPNSFDSRYYGPVKRGQILGVFQPLATSPLQHGDT
jgi:conjugative transfer signal peptidase TraF